MAERTPDEVSGYDYDVAVSFAGEDRTYVEDFVRRLQSLGIKVFYDQDELASMWGVNLVDFLEAIYSRRACYAILFVSRHYAEKKWTGHERQSMQDRALQESAPYILPVRLDDTSLPGLHSTVGYLDARQMDTVAIVNLVSEKLGQDRVLRKTLFDGKVPRTPEAIAQLLEERPDGWEYLLYGAIIRQGTKALDAKYRDHVIGYARRKGVTLGDQDAVDMLVAQYTTISEIIGSFNRVLDPSVQEAAFGSPGESGDPDRIIHIAQRFVDVQEELIDWAANLRATGVRNEHLRRVADTQARFADQPIEAMRSFADNFVAEADQMTGKLRAGEQFRLEMVVTMEIPDRVMSDNNDAWSAYRAIHISPTYSRARIHEVAKEFGVTTKEILSGLAAIGEHVQSASSTIEGPVIARLSEWFVNRC